MVYFLPGTEQINFMLTKRVYDLSIITLLELNQVALKYSSTS